MTSGAQRTVMAGEIREALAVLSRACSDVRPGKDADAVCGVIPAAVAAPGSVPEAAALLRAASDHGLAVVPRGGGTKLAWGAPPRRCDVVLDTGRLDRVIEHAAGDLVVRVQAGVPVGRLQAELGRAGQQLALDTADGNGPVSGTVSGTVGGLIATGMAGPRRLRYGAPRDLLIGITVVLADGTVASSGGKVVKNVAGYDLGKLFAGSRGTLGLIAEATFRLHPVPPDSTYVTLKCDGAAAAAEAVQAVMGTQLVPSAVEIDAPARGAPVTVAVLLEGRSDAVAERSEAMREALGTAADGVASGMSASEPPGAPAGAETSASPPAWWNTPAAPADGTLLQLSYPPAALRAVLDAIDEAAAEASIAARQGAERRTPPGYTDEAAAEAGIAAPVVRGSAGMGVLAVGLGPSAAPGATAEFVTVLRRLITTRPGSGELPGGSVTVVHAPPELRDAVDLVEPVPALGLMRAVKDQFDPGHVMAPGRLTGGI